jgi:hypothetical protein
MNRSCLETKASYADEVGSSARSQFESRTQSSLISLRSLHTLWRALTVRDEAALDAHEAASTLFRFFRSKHVIDLKIIATLAIFLLIAHFLIVVLFVIARPAIHYEVLWQTRGSEVARALVNFSNVTELITHLLSSLVTYFAAAVPVYCGVVAWAYLSAATRLGVVDLFACEIATLCRVGTAFDIGRRYVELYKDEAKVTQKQKTARHLTDKPVDPLVSHSFVSQEEYFPIFQNNSRDLQTLEATVVGHITEFYTYMKSTRDMQRKLALIDPSQVVETGGKNANGIVKKDPWHDTLANMLYVLFLGYESGRNSVADLIEFQPTRAEDTIVILLTELECYSFLCGYFRDDDVRYDRLQLREANYQETIPDLIRRVKAAHPVGERKYWAPAERTVAELEERYETSLKALTTCTNYRVSKQNQKH